MSRSFLDSAGKTSVSVSSSESTTGGSKARRDHRLRESHESHDEFTFGASSNSAVDIVGDAGERELEKEDVGNSCCLKAYLSL